MTTSNEAQELPQDPRGPLNPNDPKAVEDVMEYGGMGKNTAVELINRLLETIEELERER